MCQETRTGDPFQLYYNLPFVAEPNFNTDGVTPILSVSGGFPTVDPNTITGASVTTSAEGADTRLHAPVLDEWNLNVQHELPGNLGGNRLRWLQGNAPSVHTRPEPGSGPRPWRYPVETALSRSSGDFNNLVNRGNSNYHSLQLKAEKHISHGLCS